MKIFEIESYCVIEAKTPNEAFRNLEIFIRENPAQFINKFCGVGKAQIWDKKIEKIRNHQIIYK